MSEHNIQYPTLDAGQGKTAGTRRYRRVIDAHVHWYPQEFFDLMVKKGPANGAVMSEDSKGNPVVESVPDCTQKSVMRKTMTNLDDIINDMTEVEVVQDQEEDSADLERMAGQSPVIKFVNYLISNAVREGRYRRSYG